MNDKYGRPWVIAVILGYVALVAALFLFVASPWSWLLALLVGGKGFGFYVLMRRVQQIGARPETRPSAAAKAKPAPSTEG